MRVAARVPRAPVLFARQRQLLQLLDALGGSCGRLDFQELLFLYCQEPWSGAPYDFVPTRSGAFSFTSYADRRKLIERDLLVDDDHRWALTAQGRRLIDRTLGLELSTFVQRYRELRGDDLAADACRRFPFFATRSEIADRVLRGDREALARIAALRDAGPGAALHTIGYEGHSLESYLNRLLKGGISLLCDVRRNPISRKYGFSKNTLARGCEGVGIRYEHLPDLGIASDQRRGLETQEDYDALFAEYERSWLPAQGKDLDRIHRWVAAGACVALTCYEHLPQQCHRHCVAEALEARLGNDLRANHL